MTLVSSVDFFRLIDGEPSASLVCGQLFLLGVAACLGPLFGGDIRLGSLGLGKGPEQT